MSENRSANKLTFSNQFNQKVKRHRDGVRSSFYRCSPIN
jgi:hypothetical protein